VTSPEQPNNLIPAPRPAVSTLRALNPQACSEADKIGGGADVLGAHPVEINHAERFVNTFKVSNTGERERTTH
jgi:hypothetical protein